MAKAQHPLLAHSVRLIHVIHEFLWRVTVFEANDTAGLLIRTQELELQRRELNEIGDSLFIAFVHILVSQVRLASCPRLVRLLPSIRCILNCSDVAKVSAIFADIVASSYQGEDLVRCVTLSLKDVIPRHQHFIFNFASERLKVGLGRAIRGFGLVELTKKCVNHVFRCFKGHHAVGPCLRRWERYIIPEDRIPSLSPLVLKSLVNLRVSCSETGLLRGLLLLRVR